MPHLTIQHSPKLAERYDMAALCETLRGVMAAQGCFPVGGIRVRAWPTPAEGLADGHPDNAYVDMILRMGAGRPGEVKRAAGDAIMAAVEGFFAEELGQPHLMIALEIVEIDPDFSWKTNTIHPRLKGSA
jgi:5-carboxymethyl-2-hydroxymuconate isomerase